MILFRKDRDTEEEFEIAKSIWGAELVEYRTQLLARRKCICRYSALPYYQELEKELKLRDIEMVNSFREHKYIAEYDRDWETGKGTVSTYTFSSCEK